jgi:hypothetical protein
MIKQGSSGTSGTSVGSTTGSSVGGVVGSGGGGGGGASVSWPPQAVMMNEAVSSMTRIENRGLFFMFSSPYNEIQLLVGSGNQPDFLQDAFVSFSLLSIPCLDKHAQGWRVQYVCVCHPK